MSKTWTIEQLAAIVEQGLRTAGYDGQDSGRVRVVPDLRTIRYYTTIGLLDPPVEMRGRKAYYGRRHVLQLVAVKRLQAQGQSLVQVQKAMSGADDRTLTTWAGLPVTFWTHLSDIASSPSESIPASAPLAVSSPGDEQSRSGEWFWTAVPRLSAMARPTAASQTEKQSLRTALHIRVSDGVELILDGVDPGTLTSEALIRLSTITEKLARDLTKLPLAPNRSSIGDDTDQGKNFHQPEESEGSHDATGN